MSRLADANKIYNKIKMLNLSENYDIKTLIAKCIEIKNLEIEDKYLIDIIDRLPIDESKMPLLFPKFYISQIFERIEHICIYIINQEVEYNKKNN